MTSGVQVGSAYVALGADSSQLNSDLKRAEGTVKGWASGLSKAFTVAGAGLTAGVTAPLMMFAGKAMNTASDVNESMNKVNVVFKSSSNVITDFAEKAATSIGMSEGAALDAAGTLGNMYVQLGVGANEAAKFSTQILTAAADMASFHNAAGGAEEVMGAIQAAFRGEYDAMQRYIPTINAAAVEQMALAMTGKENAKALTAQEKALAAQAIIMRDMGPAAGDFARTMNEGANASRVMQAQLENLSGTIGDQLLPYKLQLIQAVQKVLTWFQQLSPETQRLIVIIGGIAAAAGPVLLALGAIAGAVAAIGAPVLAIIGVLGLLAAAWATNFGGIRETVMGAIQPVIDAINTAIGVFQALDAAGQTTGQSLLGAFTAFLGSLIGFQEASALVQGFQEKWQALASFFEPTIERLKSGFAAMVEGMAPIGGKLGELGAAFETLWTAVEPIVSAIAEVVGGVLVAAFNLLLEIVAAVMPSVGEIISTAIDIGITVLNTLATVVTEVVNIVKAVLEGDWAAAWTSAQTIIETLVTAAGTILEGLASIVVTVMKGIVDGVKQWLTNLYGDWQTKWEALVGVVRAKFYSILGTIIMKMNEIKGAITSFDLRAAGAALIEGMIAGIESKAAALVAKAQAVVGNAVQAAKNLLGIKSPSTVFAEIGRQMMEGLALGLSESEQKAWEALAKTFENLIQISEGLSMISGYRANANLSTNLSGMIGQMKDVVTQLADMAGWLATPRPGQRDPDWVSAKAGTDPMRDIANNISAMITAMTDIGTYKPIGDVAAKVTDIVNGYKEVVSQFADLAGWLVTPGNFPTGVELADAIGALGLMATVADAFASIFATWKAVSEAGNIKAPANMEATVGAIANMMTIIVSKLGVIKVDISDELLTFAANAGALARSFAEIATSYKALMDANDAIWGPEKAASVALPETIAFLIDFSGKVTAALQKAARESTAAPEGFDVFLGNIRAALSVIVDTAKAWEVIADFKPNKSKMDVEAVVEWLASLAGLTTRALMRIQDLGGLTPDAEFGAFVVAVKNAVGLISDTAKAWEIIRNFKWSTLKVGGDEGVINWLASMAGIATRAIEKVQDWGGITPDDQFNAFVTAVKNAVGLITDTAKAWETIQNFKPNNKLDMNAVIDWLAAVGGLALRALEKVQDWGGITPDEAFSEFTKAIKDSMGALTDTIKFVEALALWKAAKDVRTKMEALTTDLGTIIDQLNIAYVNNRGFINDSLLKFVADVGTLVQSLEYVVSFLKSIEGLSDTGNVTFAVARIKQTIDAVLEGLKDVIYTIDEERSGLIQAFSAALTSLFSALEVALKLALAIPETWTAPDAGMWSSFTAWVRAVFEDWQDYVEREYGDPAGPARLELMSKFTTAFASLFEALRAAFEATLDVSEKWGAPDAGMWSSFTSWTRAVFDDWQDYVDREYGDPTGPARLELMSKFTTAFSSLFSALRSTLEATLDMPKTWAAPDAGMWSSFTVWVRAVFDDWQGYVDRQYGQPTGPARLELMSNFAGALSSLMQGLRSALELVLAIPKTWGRPDPAKWADFETWVQGVFTNFKTYVETNYSGEGSKERLELVGTFSAAMSSLMGALKTALDLALALPTKWAPIPTGEGSPYSYLKAFVEKVWSDFAAYVATTMPADSEAAKNLPVVQTFASSLQAVMGALGSALDVMKGLQGYIPLLNSRIESFINSVTFAYGLIQTYATGAGVAAGTAATQAFAEAAGTVFSALRSALDLFKALVEPNNGMDADVEVFKTRLQTLVSRITIVMGAWKTYVETEANTSWAAGTDTFKTRLDTVFGSMKSALDIFRTLFEPNAGMDAPPDVFAARLTTFTTRISDVIRAWKTSVETTFNMTWDPQADTFGDRMADLYNTLRLAMEIFRSLFESNAGMDAPPDVFSARLQTFIGRINSVMTTWKTYVESQSAAVWSPVANDFAGKVRTTFETLKLALDIFKDLNTVGMPGPDKIAAFLEAVLDLFEAFSDGLADIPGEVDDSALDTETALQDFEDAMRAAVNWTLVGSQMALSLAWGWKVSMEAQANNGSWMMLGTIAATDAIKQAIKTAFGIASPSKVMAGFGDMVALGLANGIMGGLPDVEQAASALYRAAQPSMNLGGEWDVNARRTIVVRFEGQAGGGVPLSTQQFDQLTRQLAYQIRIGA